jgi:hypothetical protein
MKVNWNTTLNAITAGAAVLIAVTGLLAFDFAERHIEQSEQAARIEHLEARIGEYESARFVDIRKSLAADRIDPAEKRLRKIDPENPPEPLIDELNFCDDLGLRVYRGDLNRHDVWDVFSTWLFVLYRDAQPVIDAGRQKEGAAAFGDCTDLIESLKDIEVAENASPRMIHPSDEYIYQFYLDETNAQPGQPPNKIRTRRVNP